jgi:hypothetical protein
MFSALVLVSFIFAFAGAQQIFLNRLIAADMEHLKTLEMKRYEERSKAFMNRKLS